MAVRLGKQTIAVTSRISISATASIVGTKESHGPLSPYFDVHMNDAEWKEDTWEKTETKMQREAAKLAIRKSGLSSDHIPVSYTHLDVYKRQPQTCRCVIYRLSSSPQVVVVVHNPGVSGLIG